MKSIIESISKESFNQKYKYNELISLKIAESSKGMGASPLSAFVAFFFSNLRLKESNSFTNAPYERIDIIITDHHLPLAEVPDCIIIDPKHNNEDYGFDGLCGAGVAYKLVEALSGREKANKYLDILAIATVGDIVPLIDENRVIAKFGIDKINSGDCLESIKFIKEKLEIEKLNSTDISFKIVPRLNSSGRMDNAIKVFQFLTQQVFEQYDYAQHLYIL